MNKEELLEKALCCIRCGTCNGVTQEKVPDMEFSTQCPCGMTFFGAHEPAGIISIARGIAKNKLRWDRDMVKILYSCTLCGYCEDVCGRSIRYTPAISIIEELRRLTPERLKPEKLKRAAETLRIPKNHRLSILKTFGVSDMPPGKKIETLFFPDPSLLTNTAKLKEIGYILQQSGIKAGCFIGEPLPPLSTTLLNAGYHDVHRKSMALIDQKLTEHRIKKVIVYNPESLSVLNRFSETDVEFISVLRVYNDMLKRKKGKKLKLPAVTYQDPCHLVRYEKEYAVPREIINKLGLDLKDMWRSKSDALCCGAGGGVMISNQAFAGIYAKNRWKEAKATGASVMITACPDCYANLKKSRPGGFKVIDLTTLTAQALGYISK